MVECHLADFARKWRTTGLLAGDACESMHALANKLSRYFACLHGVLKSKSKSTALKIFWRELIAKANALTAKRARGQYEPRAL